MSFSFDIVACSNANWGFDAFSSTPELLSAPTPWASSTDTHQRTSSENVWVTTATTPPPPRPSRGLSFSQQSITGSNVATLNNEVNISPVKNDSPRAAMQASDPAARAFDSNLYVASLPDWFTDDDLYELFKRFGPILSAKVMCHKGTHLCKGYGFVLFQRTNDATVARSEMIGHVVGGNRIQVRRARSAATAPLGDCCPPAATASAVSTTGIFAEQPRGSLPSPSNPGSLNVSPHFVPSTPQLIPSVYPTTLMYVVSNSGAAVGSSNSQPPNPAQAMLVAIPDGRSVLRGPDNVVYMVLASPQVQASNVVF
ncbi:RNA-binding protein 5-like protein [Leptomonas seymouri]|uniref:RNA-binding protein 5-like protein n=1 Tax=Leptomonas seymouri TaxID=5684 RepID=A0A0N1I2F1_LEPSE|nr:RNA-binding protein 5-like protein [Leptomonas seymouri]|eukprot:KPI83814.1 RNA-binding protein 5-like protein [Leptomonas seymouri]